MPPTATAQSQTAQSQTTPNEQKPWSSAFPIWQRRSRELPGNARLSAQPGQHPQIGRHDRGGGRIARHGLVRLNTGTAIVPRSACVFGPAYTFASRQPRKKTSAFPTEIPDQGTNKLLLSF